MKKSIAQLHVEKMTDDELASAARDRLNTVQHSLKLWRKMEKDRGLTKDQKESVARLEQTEEKILKGLEDLRKKVEAQGQLVTFDMIRELTEGLKEGEGEGIDIMTLDSPGKRRYRGEEEEKAEEMAEEDEMGVLAMREKLSDLLVTLDKMDMADDTREKIEEHLDEIVKLLE